MLEQINQKMRELRRCTPLDDNTGKQLRRDFILEYIHNSLALEGSDLSIEETRLILIEEESLKHRSLKEHMDIFLELAGYLKVEYLLSQEEDISIFAMKELHRKSAKGSNGEFRTQRMILDKAPNQLPTPEKIPRLVKEIVEEYGFTITGTHLIHRLAYFHLNFELTHPFPTKNGSVGRLLVNLGLMKAGYPPIVFKKEDKEQYFQAFITYYQSSGNGEQMCKLLEKYVLAALENYSKYQKRDPFIILKR